VRDGVNATRLRLPTSGWDSVLDYVLHRWGHVDPDGIVERFRTGEVRATDGTVVAEDTPLGVYESVWYYRSVPNEEPIPFEVTVLHQDEHLLVADKPHFLPVTPGGRYVQQTLLVRLKNRLGIDTLSPIHRIDRETAGLLLFSLRPQDRDAYQALFRERTVHKVYEAVAPHDTTLALPLVRRSRIVEEQGAFFRMQEADGLPNSESRIDVIDRTGSDWRYALHPVSGRKHQLRVHMAALGAGIINDPFYPDLAEQGDDDHGRPLKLLARALTFDDPLSGELRRFESRLAL
jgi:tRNA pseudouridine32 synthase/23S rRNA pseudouridine746 synthase